MNLIEGLQQEMNRCRGLLKLYEEIPTGAFGAMMIKLDIQKSEQAIASDDVVQMLICLETLKELK